MAKSYSSFCTVHMLLSLGSNSTGHKASNLQSGFYCWQKKRLDRMLAMTDIQCHRAPAAGAAAETPRRDSRDLETVRVLLGHEKIESTSHYPSPNGQNQTSSRSAVPSIFKARHAFPSHPRRDSYPRAYIDIVSTAVMHNRRPEWVNFCRRA
jgi:hypothetical protein